MRFADHPWRDASSRTPLEQRQTMHAPKSGRGYRRDLGAGHLQSLIGSFELHLLAERKSTKTVRTYVEAAQWFAAEHLRPAGMTDWDAVGTADVQRWMVTLLGRYSD